MLFETTSVSTSFHVVSTQESHQTLSYGGVGGEITRLVSLGLVASGQQSPSMVFTSLDVIIWLVVEPTNLKNMLVKMGASSPRIGMKIKNL